MQIEKLFFHVSTSPVSEKLLDQIEAEMPLLTPEGEDTVFGNVMVAVVSEDAYVSTMQARQELLYERQKDLLKLVDERLSHMGRRQVVKKID